MSVTISLPDDVYQRLERLAVGFDTPVRVIERLLDEGSAGFTKARPTLAFSPDESAFKHELLTSKKAQVVLHLKSGRRQARHATSRNFGTPVAIIHSPTQRMGDALAALRPSQLRTKPCS
ncbi:hypothetical protein BHECKSOX_2442, partial [Bathymodiolus heckerae thiotrophic gill symbiont]